MIYNIVKIISKFSYELLLLESILLFLFGIWYAFYFLMHKRRLGAIHEYVPLPPVKATLAAVILQTESYYRYLFGTQCSVEVTDEQLAKFHLGSVLAAPSTSRKDEEALALSAEQGFSEDSNDYLQQIQILKEALAKSEAEKSIAPSSAPVPAGDIQQLAERNQALEAQLAEYSVLEDDLANLKSLMKENVSIKETVLKLQIEIESYRKAFNGNGISKQNADPLKDVTPSAPVEPDASLGGTAQEP